MPAGFAPLISHLLSDPGFSGVSLVLAVVFAIFAIGLLIEHQHVKHGGLRLRDARGPFALALVAILVVTTAPVSGWAQADTPAVGLPDLISDPPVIWFTRNVQTPDGDVIRALTFDGYIHNIGTGALVISGNPQVEDGMKQRVFDGSTWNEVASPTVRYETNDGHNHFHLIRAIDYELWTLDRSASVTDASKVGFCLVDTEQMEEGYDAAYEIDANDYCALDSPDTTELTMGITPGWRDTYDANVTMQWVDISDTTPGTYWVSALTDPNNEVVESNEDNNDIVFSANKFDVDGFVARELDMQQAGEPIILRSTTYGDVGPRSFVISEGPGNGTLDVPLGVDLLSINQVRYTPDPGFEGTDSFSYFAHDTTTPFPLNPPPVVVDVEVGADYAASDSNASSSPADQEPATLVGPESNATLFAPVNVEFDTLVSDAGDSGQWFGTNLPPGLTVDKATGVVSGVPTFEGEFDSTILHLGDGDSVSIAASWTITDAEVPPLTPTNDISTLASSLIRIPFGEGQPDATYRGQGLPEGGQVVSNIPQLTGVPREAGVFEVTIEEIVDDQVVDSISFTWTVRPSTRPGFAL